MDIRAVISGFAFLSTVLLIGTQSVFGANAETKSRSPGSVAEHHHQQIGDSPYRRETPSRAATFFPNTSVTTVTKCAARIIPSRRKRPLSLAKWGRCTPLEYFAESIINPNAVVPKEYRNSDGTSPMTIYKEKMTLRELIDVSAYIASLKPPGQPSSSRVAARSLLLFLRPKEIVIEHGAIKDYMDAMTMGYKVRSSR